MEKLIQNAIGNILSLYNDLSILIDENGINSEIFYNNNNNLYIGLTKHLDDIVDCLITKPNFEWQVRDCIRIYSQLRVFARQNKYVIKTNYEKTEKLREVDTILKKYDNIGLFWD